MTPDNRKKLVAASIDAIDSVFLEYTCTCSVEMLDDIANAALAVAEDRIRNEVLEEAALLFESISKDAARSSGAIGRSDQRKPNSIPARVLRAMKTKPEGGKDNE